MSASGKNKKKSRFLWFRKHKGITKALIWFRNVRGKKNEYKYFWPTVVFSILLVFSLWYFNYDYGLSLCKEQRGIFGDMFGAVNAAFSGLAFAGIIISLYLQRIDLKNQFEEIQQTNKEFKIQNDTLQLQKFENQYYKMIELHRGNVQEMKISFFDFQKVPYQDATGHGYRAQEFLRDIDGRKIFVGMLNEFNALYHILENVSNDIELKLTPKDLIDYSYQVFFYGKNSKKIDFGDCPGKFKDKLFNILKQKQEEFYNRNKAEDSKFRKNEYYLKFYPFEGHESRLAHYYRHLFQTVKYVIQQEEKKLISYSESRQYLRVLRAQLSNAEQVLLYYNYLADFGNNWDYLGKKGYRFLTKYRMLHNIPFESIATGIEDPRDHFKDYIKKHATEEDPLFEWGDIY
ncbi:putative phage abortive infection protein [Subsaxibacter sp. CAU 1640]|uniref:putative phage abortive infection protein n=1 Tax=Subsaxibacter sp. CAU 1640 TaxID=2933271 RepID=UPI002003C21C|nr:putative phage abortive infection protein [Subsaxibacter sp. CAU 1640]MCK7590607.1 putative phage abortive infection protein [Subsaxibacter sp. CAU 1640]